MNVGKAANKGKQASFAGLGETLPLLCHLAATGSLPEYVCNALPHLKPALNQAHFEKMVALFAQRIASMQNPLLENGFGVLHFVDGINTSTGGNCNYLCACYTAYAVDTS